MPSSSVVHTTTGASVVISSGVLAGVGPAGPPGEIVDTFAYLRSSVAQPVPSSWTIMDFDELVHNVNQCLNVGGPRDFYVYADGVYVVSAAVSFDSGAAGSRRSVAITVDGVQVAAAASPTLSSDTTTTVSASVQMKLSSQNLIRVIAVDDSNSGLNATYKEFRIVRVGSGQIGPRGEAGPEGPVGPVSTVPGPASFAQLTNLEPMVRQIGDLWVNPDNELFAWEDAFENVSLLSGWTSYSSSYPTLGAKRLPFSQVRLRGLVKNTSATPATTIAILSPEHRPAYSVHVTCASRRNGTQIPSLIKVAPDGSIQFGNMSSWSGTCDWVSIEFTYDTDPLN